MTNRYLAYGKGPRWEMSRFRRRIDEELHQYKLAAAVVPRGEVRKFYRSGVADLFFPRTPPSINVPLNHLRMEFFFSLRFVSPWWETDGFGVIWEDRENTIRMSQTKIAEKSGE